ncbi:NUDIX hydrolase [Halomonas sp. ISL-60]|uniref:NUDIX hydrolase n=1 Tax=Halomonas sp. ISL-56 TaxID=2819149 RepID=UPI001BECD467|nr:NUDIX hydrolase [Halomonas sp. ISL-56]MBT2772748.1 NUDIX hydrolase [Halomonas sp. ISL-60]MBT2800543.1 NUDIX hydrolase [Halomonas sp. ISL-56]
MNKITTITEDNNPKVWGLVSNYEINICIDGVSYTFPRETYSVGDFVSIVPVNISQRYTYLIEQPRAAMLKKYDQLSLEACGGKVDSHGPLYSAVNELHEECGITCNETDINFIGDVMVSPGSLEEKSYLYYVDFSEDQVADELILDEKEPLIRRKVYFDEINNLIQQGYIKDLRTLYLLKKLEERKVL